MRKRNMLLIYRNISFLPVCCRDVRACSYHRWWWPLPPTCLLLDAQFGVLFLLGGLGRAVTVGRIRSTAGRVRLVPTDVDRFGLAPNAVLRNVNGLHIRSGHFEHRFEQERFLRNSNANTLLTTHCYMKCENPTMMALSPRAPVCLSIASCAICFRAASAKVSST